MEGFGTLVRLCSALLVASVLSAGCAEKPLPQMDNYVGATTQGDRTAVSGHLKNLNGRIDVGLLLVNDTSFTGSAPALSDKAKAFLTDQVRQRIPTATPIQIVKVLTPPDSSQDHNAVALAGLARKQGLSYVLLALFSSEESEVYSMLPLGGDPQQGGGRPLVPGFETDNFALVELALISSADGEIVARSHGRAWSRLNRLNFPTKSNVYPVIHRSLRVAPIYPPEKDAKDVLRSIAGDEALGQAVMHLAEAWPKSILTEGDVPKSVSSSVP